MLKKLPALLRLFFLLTSFEAFAFNPGDQVYVKTVYQTWMPATYVGKRDDCFRLEGSRNSKDLTLVAPSKLIEGKIEKGSEVFRIFGDLKSQFKIKFIVREVKLSCHEVDKLGGVWNDKSYVNLSDVMPSVEFQKLIGLKAEFATGDLVYAQNQTRPESWSLYKVISKQNNCFETDSDKILSKEDIVRGELYSLPTPYVKKLKEGNSVFIQPSYQKDLWIIVEIKIKRRIKDKVTLLLPYVDAEGGFFEEEVNISDIMAVPPQLSENDYARLKLGMTVLQYFDPSSCDYDSYIPRKIVVAKNRCYLLQNAEYEGGTETETYLPDKLIEEKALR